MIVSFGGSDWKCRKPTAAEFNPMEVQRLLMVASTYQKRIIEAEEDPQPGTAQKIGKYLEIIGEAYISLRKLLVATFKEIAVEDFGLFVSVLDDSAQAQLVFDAACALLQATQTDGDLLPKS